MSRMIDVFVASEATMGVVLCRDSRVAADIFDRAAHHPQVAHFVRSARRLDMESGARLHLATLIKHDDYWKFHGHRYGFVGLVGMDLLDAQRVLVVQRPPLTIYVEGF